VTRFFDLLYFAGLIECDVVLSVEPLLLLREELRDLHCYVEELDGVLLGHCLPTKVPPSVLIVCGLHFWDRPFLQLLMPRVTEKDAAYMMTISVYLIGLLYNE
jgi:hypothetical protein